MSDTDQPASSEPEEPQTPQRNGTKQRPTQQLSRSDSETDPGYRSRSQSRRARRRKQQKGGQQKKPMPAVEENQEPEDPGETMQPFEMIGPDETSMNGPVTYAKAQRGEIPKRPGNPEQQLATGPKGDSGGDSSGMMDQDGLKLRIELNLDIEIELKASIHGDITLALL